MSLADSLIAEWRQLGVPSAVWAPITAVESGGNPTAVGDNGTSFGELQLHIDGGQGTGHSIGELENPIQNVAIGGPPIASAYNAGLEKGLSGFNLVAYTASHSGHPSDTGEFTPGYEDALRKAYNAPQHSLGSVTTAMNNADVNGGSVMDILNGMGYGSTDLAGTNQIFGGSNIIFNKPPTAPKGVFGSAWQEATAGASQVASDVTDTYTGVEKALAEIAKPFEDFATTLDKFVAWVSSGNALWLVIGLVIGIVALVAWLRA